MKNGWRMKEIDEMDMLGFLCLRTWDAIREQEKKKPRHAYIDEVWRLMKPQFSNFWGSFPSSARNNCRFFNPYIPENQLGQ